MDGGRLFLMAVGGMALLLACVEAESEPNAYAPELDMRDTDGNKVDVYRGFIVSDETTVSLVPELIATDKDEIGGARFICGYRIYSDDYDIPFEAQLTSHIDGKAVLRLKEGTNLNKIMRQKFKFQIAAFDCGSPTLHSEKAHVVIQVLKVPDQKTPPLPSDIKNLIDKRIEIVSSKQQPTEELKMEKPPAPVMEKKTDNSVIPPLPAHVDNGGEQFFERLTYMVAIKEATLYDSILRLRPAAGASDVNICGYEIITADVPFAVDEQGNVRNTKALEYSVHSAYSFSVIAKHCDGLVSKAAVINVQVSEICTNGWKELPTDEEYKAGTKAIRPFSSTWFDTCGTSCEQEESVSITVSLDSKDEINTCEHDTFSIQSQRDSCGASPNNIDLLPQGEEWTKTLTEVEGHEAAYKFDGKTAVKVPSDKSNHTLGNFFTISTWMQHGQEKKDGHKEHVLCNADGNGMNRHHYALFVHNCRLVFLLRKEASEVDSLDKFQPAEWRWTIPHVCDGKWHHYALSVNYPNVNLFVDGQKMQTDKDVVEVVDDWALHPTDKVTFEQLTVGGCWRGETSSFGQFFDGSLAGLSLLVGTTETERVIKCMNNCGEKLQFHSMDKLSVGMSVSFNTELTELTIRGSDVSEVKAILRDVGYTNTNGQPKPGYRTLHIHTNATCDNKPLAVKDQSIPVLVSAVTDPEITIAGVSSKTRTPAEFAAGVDLFTEIMILSQPNKQLVGQENRINKLDIEDVNMLQKDLKQRLLLDRCQVRVNTKMNSVHETIRLPTNLLVKYLLDTKEFDEGFDITGSESFTNYENVIRETFYVNDNVDEAFTGRKFTITCSDMNGKFISEPFTVQLGVMEKKSQSAVLYSDVKFDHLSGADLSADVNVMNVAGTATTGASSGAVIAIVVVCVALLVVVIAVAVVRIRTVQSRTKSRRNPNVAVEDGPEMEWDNSTLNITVNPLEADALMTELKTNADEVDSEDELMSSDDEGDDSPKDGGLEWDNSSY